MVGIDVPPVVSKGAWQLMCGFAGFISTESLNSFETALVSMADAIRHRGPDDSGLWIDKNAGIGLAHRRLSIVDLTPAGHQPMHSACDRYVIAFNGEIYNHESLRRELNNSEAPPIWRGHSDTEVMLAAISKYGLAVAISKFVGMFAFALWDKHARLLHLVRDRMGEKPLYYGWQGNTFLFGSEIKALRQHPAFQPEIDRGSLCLLLRHNYIPAPYSIYKGIRKLEPGCLVTVSSAHTEPKIMSYWSTAKVSVDGSHHPFSGTPEQAVDELEALLKSSIRQQMVADVPLGAFLSGGIDSSAIVALMQAEASKPVRTFTIGFNEQGYNEAEHAKAVARHLGTEHTELYVSPEQALDVIPKLPSLYCEPFADPSQIPTFLVSQMARKQVKVALSGDAGDELFAGYNRYQFTENLWHKLSLIPIPLRKLISEGIISISPAAWNNLGKLFPRGNRYNAMGDKLHKGAAVLTSLSIDELYIGLVSHHKNPSTWVLNSQEPQTNLTGLSPDLNSLNGIQRMMALDAITYLPDDILVKVDRAAMGVSLESRVPFLDHRIVEFAATLPLSYKLRSGKTKWPLRQILYKYVPKELIERPKMGFGVPLHDWLRGPLNDWAESLLDESRLRKENFLDSALVRKCWREHISGRRNWAYLLWNVLMFQAWMELENA